MLGVMVEKECAACHRSSHINKDVAGIKCAYCGAEFLPEPTVVEEETSRPPRIKTA